MSNKTPQKSDVISGFSTAASKKFLLTFQPVFDILFLVRQSPAASPQKNLTGTPRIVRDIVADLFNNIQKWNNFHIQGCQTVKQIGLIKSDIFGSYSSELEEETDKLYKIVQNITLHVELFKKFGHQMCALEKLHSKEDVLFISCSINELKENIELISCAYIKEFSVSYIFFVFF